MNIRDLNGKRICILGFGKEGRASLRAISRYAKPSEIIVADADPGPAGYRLPFHSIYTCAYGPGYVESIPPCDIIIKSPGIPPPVLAEIIRRQRKNIPTITSSTQIFLDTVAESGAMIIGVTGSKGKSTTATLIHTILKAAGKHSVLAGNIGDPAMDQLGEAKPKTIFVLEMSSYQLMDLTSSPHIAVITSFFPEHLDYHGSLENYLEAKKHITRFQSRDDLVFFAADSKGTRAIAEQSSGKRVPFSTEDAPVTLEETKLIGRHNLGNIAAAFLVSQELGVPKEIVIGAIRAFTPLPHRLQSLGVIGGLEWVDDSISTTPESAIAALDALGDRVETIILGGQDRGYDFTELGRRIARSSVKNVILFPGSGPRIRKSVEAAKASVSIVDADTMEEAISFAKMNTEVPARTSFGTGGRIPNPESQIVLLSPASPSYGMFKNFEERGDAFRRAI